MDRQPITARGRWLRRSLVSAMAVATGCSLAQKIPEGPHDTVTSYHDGSAMRIEYPDARSCPSPQGSAAAMTARPRALVDPASVPSRDMTLEQAVQQAMRTSPVLRNIGGAVVTQPGTVATSFTPGLTHSDPQLGPEAALSAFDAVYSQAFSISKIDQPFNRIGLVPVDPAIGTGGVGTGGTGAAGGGAFGSFFTPFSQATTSQFSNSLTKASATGGRYTISSNILYVRTDDPSRGAQAFPSSFTGFLQSEYRQPLMRGAGVTYNRIAGPNPVGNAFANVGQYNGVLIARVREDVALADFERAVIQLVNDVEETYWNLTTAYRVYEATAKGREAALQTFQYQQVRLEVGTGRRDEEAQARSQFYQFEAQLQSALASTTGIYELEQQLRYLIGMPATDDTLIRPSTDPVTTRVVFDWEDSLGQSLARRVEIRRQRYNVRQRELELTAARLGRAPQIDFVGQHRIQGLGDHLIGGGNEGQFDNLADSFASGNFQEWTAAIEILNPVGLRQASAAVANANLSLRREQAVLSETELRISHDLSDASRLIELTHQLVETNYNRYRSDLRQVDVLRRRYRDGTDNINFLLQAQRQVVTSESEFYRAITNYQLALRDFHREKGSLLAYNRIGLNEGEWCPGANRDSYELGRFLEPRPHPGKVCVPRGVSTVPFDPAAPQGSVYVPGPVAAGPEMIESVPLGQPEPQ